MDARTLTDSGWVTGLFGGTVMQRDTRFLSLRRYSNAMLSFEDTTIGGSAALNAPPQFTIFADPPITGAFAQPSGGRDRIPDGVESGSYRLGAYYFESIADNSFYLHCRYGKPKYLGIASFFTSMYDTNLAYLARTGDYPGICKTMGTYIAAAAIWAATGTVAFAAILIIPRILKMALDKQSSRYWYLKPTMHLYLRAVQNILNTQLVYRRLVPTGVLGTFKMDNDISDESNKYHADRAEMYSMLPTIWKDNGEFDVYRMINRYQTLANYQAKKIAEIRSVSTSETDMNNRLRDFYERATYSNEHRKAAASLEVSLFKMEKLFSSASSTAYTADVDLNKNEDALINGMNGQIAEAQAKGGTAADYENTAEDLSKNLKGEMDSIAARQQQAAEMQGSNEELPDISELENWENKGIEDSKVKNFFKDFITAGENIADQWGSEIRNGSQWITWRIDGKDTVSRSFSNSTKEPEISGVVNSATQKARSLEVNLSGGKTGFDPIDGIITGLKSAFTGALDTLQLTGIMSLYNSSVIDFPEVWDSSDCSGDDISLNLPLRAWSGSDLDVFQDILVPLSFWIAAVCPLATGKQSYTHPFYLECYSQGRFSMRNAMVTNIGMTFGAGGLGWRKDGVPLGIDLNITIRDLSRAMYMPIVTDTAVWDDDNKFSEFVAVLGAATLYQRTNGIERARINASIWAQSWASAWSQGSIMNAAMDKIPARQIANIFLPQAR